MLASGIKDGFPFVVLERLPGTDIGTVFTTLTRAEKLRISEQVWRIQEQVGRSLTLVDSFGFLRTPDDMGHRSWSDVIEDSLRRSEQRLTAAGDVRRGAVERLRTVAHSLGAYFASVKPVPFLDDLTTKNVLVHRGKLSGVVDVDWVCNGDPLLVIGLTRASLLGGGHETDYADHWCHLMHVDSVQQAALRFYTALFFLDFLSESGQQLNRDRDASRAQSTSSERLEALLHDAIDRFRTGLASRGVPFRSIPRAA